MDINEKCLLFPEIKRLFESNAEIAIDSDFTLPDYYPEISRILKCLTEINVLQRQKSDNKINIGGQLVVTLLYSDRDNEFNSYTHIIPFAKSFDCEKLPDDISINVIRQQGYLNPKATSPRRIELHGAENITVIVDGCTDTNIAEGFEERGIFSKRQKINYTKRNFLTDKYLFIENDISVGQRPPIGKILRSSSKAEITDSRIINGKAVIKGEFSIIMLYCPVGMQKPMLVSDKFGFSQTFECNSDEDKSIICANSEVISLELHPKTSLDGEVKTVSFEAKIRIAAEVLTEAECEIVKDAFSKEYDLDINKTDISVEHMFGNISEILSAEKKLDFSGGVINNVFDLWCTAETDYAGTDGNDILIKGTVEVSIIGLNADGEPTYAERGIEFEYREESENHESITLCKPNVSVAAVNYNEPGDGSIDVSIELKVAALTMTSEKKTVINKIESSTKTIKAFDSETAVILYFAENETIWNIAKTYGCDPDEIKRINGDTDIDHPLNKTLLIPNV